MFNLVNTVISTEETSDKGLYHTETSQLLCFAKRLAGLCMMLDFTGRYFRAEYVLIVLIVKLLPAMVKVALSKSLVYCYYVDYN